MISWTREVTSASLIQDCPAHLTFEVWRDDDLVRGRDDGREAGVNVSGLGESCANMSISRTIQDQLGLYVSSLAETICACRGSASPVNLSPA